MKMTLTEFLLARIAEDQRRVEGGYCHRDGQNLAECEAKKRIIGVWVAQWSIPEEGFPSRPLGGQGGEVYYEVLWHLASVYADHPDFREEWRP